MRRKGCIALLLVAILCPAAAATFNLIVVSVGCWALLGSERVAVIPASIVLEGLMMPHLPFGVINFALDTFLALGWLLIALASRKRS